MKLTIYSIFINFLFINLTLGHPPNVDSNLPEFKVKIQKNWTQQKEYEYLFNVESIGQAMALTVYQAKIVPKEPINWQLEMDGNESVLYEFSIPNHWARSELELRIELAQSGQIILRRFILDSLKPVILDSSNAPHIPSKCAIKEIQISILAEGRQVENAVKDKHKQIYDPFHLHQHEIAQRITDVNERKSICKSRRKRALKTLDKYLYDQSLNKFQIAQIIRDYDWLCYYEMKLQAGILMEYFGHNKNQAIEQNISVLVKELEAYRKELLKQQEDYLRQLETSGDGLSAGNLPNREGVKGLLETRFYKELNELEASVYAELAKASLPYPFSAAVHQPPHGQLDKAKSKGKLPQTEDLLTHHQSSIAGKRKEIALGHPTQSSFMNTGATAEGQAPEIPELDGSQLRLSLFDPSDVHLAHAVQLSLLNDAAEAQSKKKSRLDANSPPLNVAAKPPTEASLAHTAAEGFNVGSSSPSKKSKLKGKSLKLSLTPAYSDSSDSANTN